VGAAGRGHRPRVRALASRWPAWHRGAVIDLDAHVLVCHSEKESAAATFKHTFGYHPLLAFCDNTEFLAALLRLTGRAIWLMYSPAVGQQGDEAVAHPRVQSWAVRPAAAAAPRQPRRTLAEPRLVPFLEVKTRSVSWANHQKHQARKETCLILPTR
jgi:Transposase DDE domain group 1